MRRKTDVFAATRHLAASTVLSVGALGVICPTADARPAQQNRASQRAEERLDEVRRQEGDTLLRLTDAAMAGRPGASDFAIEWRNDFLKAQPGTFVPFTVTLHSAGLSASSLLIYVRAARRDDGTPAGPLRAGAVYPFEAVFPLELPPSGGLPVRISRGFAVPSGDYDVYVAIRERAADPLAIDQPRLKSAVLKQPIAVPDFWTGELTTSTVMLADRIETVEPIAPQAMFDRPYVLGDRDVHLASTTHFRKDRELLVMFLIYNPTVTATRHFDLQVDYHVFMHVPETAVVGTASTPDHPPARVGERYVTRTRPQRFNPSSPGVPADASAGDPVMAGQGILLSSFQEGEYRLGITVTDLLSRKTLSRDVTFTVVGS